MICVDTLLSTFCTWFIAMLFMIINYISKAVLIILAAMSLLASTRTMSKKYMNVRSRYWLLTTNIWIEPWCASVMPATQYVWFI